MGKYAPILNGYEWRKPPKDIEWHYIINQVKYVEEFMAQGKLAYDNDWGATIELLARYYRNHKEYDKDTCETLIYDYITKYYIREFGYEPVSECASFLKLINAACSNRKYKNCHGYKPLRDFDGITVTANEIETIKQLTDLESQELLFGVLCFTKMYDETNRREGRKINHLFYVEDSVLRRCIGWKRGTKQKLEDVMMLLNDTGLLGTINNNDKYAFVSQGRQPPFSKQCKIVDDESEVVLYIDNFDTLGLTWQFLLGNKHVKKCACGRYFEANSNAQKQCVLCGNGKIEKVKKPKQNTRKMSMKRKESNNGKNKKSKDQRTQRSHNDK